MSDDSPAKELARKLGIKKGSRLAVMNPPYGFVQSLVTIRADLHKMHTEIQVEEARDMDVILYFSRGKKGLEEAFPKLKGQLAPGGALWVGWRKWQKGATVDAVRAIGLEHGMKGADVLAVDREWTVLKFPANGDGQGRNAEGKRAAKGARREKGSGQRG